MKSVLARRVDFRLGWPILGVLLLQYWIVDLLVTPGILRTRSRRRRDLFAR